MVSEQEEGEDLLPSLRTGSAGRDQGTLGEHTRLPSVGGSGGGRSRLSGVAAAPALRWQQLQRPWSRSPRGAPGLPGPGGC